MSKGFRIVLLIILALLMLVAGVFVLGGLFEAGFLGFSFYSTLLKSGPLFLLLALVFYKKLIFIVKSSEQVSLGKEIRNYVACFFFTFLAMCPGLFSYYIWCYEALVRDIGLLPGTCWYN